MSPCSLPAPTFFVHPLFTYPLYLSMSLSVSPRVFPSLTILSPFSPHVSPCFSPCFPCVFRVFSACFPQGHKTNATLFPTPHPVYGKGVLVQGTLWGNLILGPTARDTMVKNEKTGEYELNPKVRRETRTGGGGHCTLYLVPLYPYCTLYLVLCSLYLEVSVSIYTRNGGGYELNRKAKRREGD